MDIVLTGSVAYDYIMTFPGYFRDHILTEKLDSISLSFLVDKMVIRRGGNAPNIAYTLALLGERPRLMATVGENFQEYRTWLESQGIDTTAVQVIAGVQTASFFANIDRANAQIASFYTGAMAYAAQLSFKNLTDKRPDLAVISPNDPQAMIKYVDECSELGIPYLYDPSQQIVRMQPEDLRRGIEGARALFVNDYEFSLIEKHLDMDRVDVLRWVEILVVTRGENGADIFSRQEKIHIPAVPVAEVVDPTGVGDAFRGGFLVGYAHDWDLELCGQIGSLAAAYCLEGDGPQSQSFSRQEFVNRFRQHFNDHGKLDELIVYKTAL
jgi:adenosine kinase